MIYELLVEHLATTILENRLLSEGGHRRGTGGVITAPGAKTGVSIRSLRKLNPSNPKVHSGISTKLVVRDGKVLRVPKTDVKPDDTLAEAYLSKYSYRTPKETMASRVTVDPKTGEEKSSKTWAAVTDAQADITKLENLKTRVKETGKPHDVTFIGKSGNQLKPETHREVEHNLSVQMHMGEPHVFHKGQKVKLRATGNGLHLLAPGLRNDRIIAHSGMLSSPHFGGVATSRGRREGRAAEVRVSQMAVKRTKVAKKVAKKRKLSSEVKAKAAAVQGKAKKLTPPPPAAAAPTGSRIADIMKRYPVPKYTGKEDPSALGRLIAAGVIRGRK